MDTRVSDVSTLFDLVKESNDAELIAELISEVAVIDKHINMARVTALFDDEMDAADCFLEINAGAGGTESNDWAEMLSRMYERWCTVYRNFKVEIVDTVPGDAAGIKSMSMKISGRNAHGWVKTESGVHRLVRISPFDANAKRHTSFASVWVYPIVAECEGVEISPGDLRIDTFRASGAGGQHVNKTDSAIRITHMPSGIVVQCQNDRSQHRNKAEAMAMLKARLYDIERKKQEADLNKNSEKLGISWGSQIRSYVLHPYQMVKDLRTRHETGNTRRVLDGDLDDFVTATLIQTKS